MDADLPSAAWYRQPWPWLLMSGPAIVVVAGAFTTALAVATSDGVVADDYYKQGLGINRVLERERRAADLHVGADIRFDESREHVRATLRLRGEPPAMLKLTVVHPTLAGEDQAITLAPVAPGLYEGALKAPYVAGLRLRLEDAPGNWRLTGSWRVADRSVALQAAAR